MNAIDTNVLLYAVDPRDPRKQLIAQQLIAELDDGDLLWQVACEYLSAARKLAPFGFTEGQSLVELNVLRTAWASLTPTWDVIDRATELRAQFSLSFWDSLIISQCLEANVSQLFTEDFDAYPKIDQLIVINPFA